MRKVTKLVTWESFDVNDKGIQGMRLKGLTQITASQCDGKVTITTGPRGYEIRVDGSRIVTEIPTGNVRFALVEDDEVEQPAKPVQQQGRR